MGINTDDIKKLRAETGAGFLDCKKALDQSEGDYTKSKEYLKEKGLAIAAKKASRTTGQGVVEVYSHGTGRIGVMVELLCETDFVARNSEFKNLAHELAMHVAAMDPSNLEELLKQAYIRDAKLTIEDLLKQHIAKISENIVIGRFLRFELGQS